MSGQEITDICNTIVTALNGYFQFNATVQAANKAFYAALFSGVISVITLIANVYLARKQIKRDTTKTYTQLFVDEKFKALDELRKSMASIIGLSYDLWRRSYIIAKSDGSPRFDEYKIYRQLSMVDFNKTLAIIKFRLDNKKYESFFQEINDFQEEVESSANKMLKNKDVMLDSRIKSFEGKCHEVLNAEWEEINQLAQKSYMKSKR